MARIKLVYLGGGSTRAAGTMASFMANGTDFDGSEVVLVDLDPDRLALIRSRRRPTAVPHSTPATRCSRRFAPVASRRASTMSASRSSTA